MIAHLRSNFLLLVLTVALCCVAYPVVLLVIGKTAFHDKAEGSLLYDKNGTAIGSRLIAQPFTGEQYFHPRPSAVSYNAAGSGASNWGANNPNLRKRVVAALGSLLKYRDGRPVGPDIVKWARETLGKDQPDIAGMSEADLQTNYFEAWWTAHPTADVEPVPADLVMTSGCGLDPHITLQGALYQLDRVAAKWAATTKRDPAQVKTEIETLLREKSAAPLGGLVGVDLVNVLEINLALKDRYGA